MGLFDAALGVAKLASNFLGGGSGKKVTTSGSTNETRNTTSSTSANRREYSDGFLQLLESGAADAIRSSSTTKASLESQVDKVNKANLGGPGVEFDGDAFIRGIVTGARNSIENSLRGNVNAIAAGTGGSSSGNSAAALLENRMRTEAAAQLGSIEQQATGQAVQLELATREQKANELASGTNQLTQLGSAMDSSMIALINALRGGETDQTVEAKENTNTSGSSSQTSKQAFNWTQGLGNLFKDINQD